MIVTIDTQNLYKVIYIHVPRIPIHVLRQSSGTFLSATSWYSGRIGGAAHDDSMPPRRPLKTPPSQLYRTHLCRVFFGYRAPVGQFELTAPLPTWLSGHSHNRPRGKASFWAIGKVEVAVVRPLCKYSNGASIDPSYAINLDPLPYTDYPTRVVSGLDIALSYGPSSGSALPLGASACRWP